MGVDEMGSRQSGKTPLSAHSFASLLFLNQRKRGKISMKEHYENIPMQYTAIFHGCKIDNFQMKKFDIFLIFAQNINCGYTLELPQ